MADRELTCPLPTTSEAVKELVRGLRERGLISNDTLSGILRETTETGEKARAIVAAVGREQPAPSKLLGFAQIKEFLTHMALILNQKGRHA